MILIMKFFVLWNFCVSAVVAIQFPPEIKLCHMSDPNRNECLSRSIEKALSVFSNGNEELGIPALEPFSIEKIETKGTPGSPVSLQQTYTNIYTHGLTQGTVNFSLDMTLDKCSWECYVTIPSARMEADYDVKGQLFIFPIDAEGKCNISQYNAVYTQRIECEKYTKNNEVYLKLTKCSVTMKAERVEYEFGNLFPSNEMIAAQIANTMKENSIALFDEFKIYFENIFARLSLNIGNRIFSKMPLNEIFLD